ncbi:3-carboxy-cis,cis-muconate cycloisomerase [Bradyrhizobium sp. CIR48]|uniref:3-carboxy-cis,cis-muconate cycloisomerase n=1 Tax=Bradyrhizobium sp. CIR48 TaxID=2663840 RepID=UPI001605E64B|nr:3-carboxy-cis,cis-muconate cycloisomerase [Bradyrhizobium sp. CIR48]MBB4423841.1 3-carboxy-cis,cis-muconate cycloisomerase [Bradyrhizobium sp. CIR48]
MPSTVTESLIFRDMFGTPAMREIFSDEALVRNYLNVEAALARAEARFGIVPEQAASTITQAAAGLVIDFDRLRRETEIVGYPIVAIVNQLAEASGEAGRYVHWGATTQDIMDTATILQIRRALDLVACDLREVQEALSKLCQRHRFTAMAGRTHLQQALPVTFGYKAAIWMSMINRHVERLEQIKQRVLTGELGGAAGTLASLGNKGLSVQEAFCQDLQLQQPTAPWHVARDGLAEVVAFLGLVTGSLAKIATDVTLLMTTEFSEVAEPFVKGRGASSTMPQKHNPISSELMLACAMAVRQNVALMLNGMVHDLERATGPWHVEWIAIPDSFVLTAGALAQAKFMLGGIIVHPDRMRANLGISGGLIVAEAVMMAAAPKLGRQKAHEVVYDACRVAATESRSLADVLLAYPSIVEALGSADDVRAVCDPANYLGQAPQVVDRVLAEYARLRGCHAPAPANSHS